MIKPNVTVLFQGDSITDCGRSRENPPPNNGLGNGYPLLIAGHLLAERPADALRFLNRGVSGNRIVDLYARIKADVINLKPNLLSVLIGVNDTWHEFGSKNGVAVPKYERIFTDFLIEVQAALPDINLVLCEPFVLPCGVVTKDWIAEMDERRTVVKKLAGKFGAVFVPFQAMFEAAIKQAPPEYWAADGVHPTNAGHALMARTWLKEVAGAGPHHESVNAYLAADGFVAELVAEIGEVQEIHGRLVIAPGPRRPAAWAADVWLNPERIAIQSIADAGKQLRARQSYWALYSFQLHRRAQLIAAQTHSLPANPTAFPAKPPRATIGGWTLLDEHTILAATQRSCPFPLGEINFIENHTAPPSRAYLKLWELFSRLQVWPKAGERCLDLGACPGGWTWVLQSLGAQVIAVDKAPLDPRIAKLPDVECRQESAFGLKPEPTDWLFSDVICEPARLLKLVERWLPVAANIVCTLKFKGTTDHATARAFAAIPGSRLLHLHHNRHELTWFRLIPELMSAVDI